jgi:outer membrane immunogenic protein
MRKCLLATTALIGIVGIGSATAADLPVKARPMAPLAAPVFSWTGCYIGGHIGLGWGRDTVSIPNLAATAEVPPAEVAGISVPPVSADTRGFLGGGQIGCDYQFASNWVIGIEGTISASDIKGDASETVLFQIPGTAQVVPITGIAHGKTEWLSSATGRLGWSWDRWLVYAKGGAAWAKDKYSADIPIFSEHLEDTETRTGWTVGAGVEWAFWNNWSAKLEYDFYDFGTRTVTLTGFFPGVGPSTAPPGPIAAPGIEVQERISVVKLGINYRFGLGGPVVAKY